MNNLNMGNSASVNFMSNVTMGNSNVAGMGGMAQNNNSKGKPDLNDFNNLNVGRGSNIQRNVSSPNLHSDIFEEFSEYKLAKLEADF